MILRRVALDANLLVLPVVGKVHPGLIANHKRLSAFNVQDFALLLAHLKDATLMITPNAMTEASNLIAQGVRDPLKSELFDALKAFSETTNEEYVPSIQATSIPEFLRLGLTDAAWLSCLESGAELLTADLNLFLAAQRRGFAAVNFNHLRDR